MITSASGTLPRIRVTRAARTAWPPPGRSTTSLSSTSTRAPTASVSGVGDRLQHAVEHDRLTGEADAGDLGEGLEDGCALRARGGDGRARGADAEHRTAELDREILHSALGGRLGLEGDATGRVGLRVGGARGDQRVERDGLGRAWAGRPRRPGRPARSPPAVTGFTTGASPSCTVTASAAHEKLAGVAASAAPGVQEGREGQGGGSNGAHPPGALVGHGSPIDPVSAPGEAICGAPATVATQRQVAVDVTGASAMQARQHVGGERRELALLVVTRQVEDQFREAVVDVDRRPVRRPRRDRRRR